METEVIKFEIAKLNLKEGDILVFKTDQDLCDENIELLSSTMEKLVPNQILLLQNMDLASK